MGETLDASLDIRVIHHAAHPIWTRRITRHIKAHRNNEHPYPAVDIALRTRSSRDDVNRDGAG